MYDGGTQYTSIVYGTIFNALHIYYVQIRTRLLMDFACAGGQNVLLVGPHGSGKTTMVNDFLNAQGKFTVFISYTALISYTARIS